MFFRLFLLFTLVPLLELFLLLRIGSLIGAGSTLLLVIATGVAGAWMARKEGLRSWLAVQRELGAGRFPGEELLHSLLILVAGVVLVTPGVLTDLAGICLLARPLRQGLIRRLRERFAARVRAAGRADGPGASFRIFWWDGSRGDAADGAAWPERGELDGGEGDRDMEREESGRRPPRVIEL